MGGSSSKSVSNNENNQTIVNKNTMKIMNEQVNTAIAKTTINNSASCKQSTNQSQVLDMSGCEAGGDIIIGGPDNPIDFTQVATVNFSCIQVAKIENEVAQEIMGEIMGKIKSGLDSESLNKMTAYAESEAKSGFLATGSSDSDSTANNTFNLNVKNDNLTDISNVVKNSINVEFNAEDVQECVNEVEQHQELNAKNCKAGGDVKVGNIKFNQGVSATAECLQTKGISQKITNAAGTVLGVVVEADTKSKAVVEQDASSKSSATSSGVADVFGASLGSITGSMSSIAGGPIASSGISSVVCCCCIISIILIAVLFYFTTGEGQETKGDIKSAYSAFKGSRATRRTGT